MKLFASSAAVFFRQFSVFDSLMRDLVRTQETRGKTLETRGKTQETRRTAQKMRGKTQETYRKTHDPLQP